MIKVCYFHLGSTFKGDHAFSANAPKLWNNLSLDMRPSGSTIMFKTRLKTHLYTVAFTGSYRWSVPVGASVYFLSCYIFNPCVHLL